jgi:hypothetical protein
MNIERQIYNIFPTQPRINQELFDLLHELRLEKSSLTYLYLVVEVARTLRWSERLLRRALFTLHDLGVIRISNPDNIQSSVITLIQEA